MGSGLVPDEQTCSELLGVYKTKGICIFQNIYSDPVFHFYLNIWFWLNSARECLSNSWKVSGQGSADDCAAGGDSPGGLCEVGKERGGNLQKKRSTTFCLSLTLREVPG